MFSKKRGIRSFGRVAGKIRSSDLSAELWGVEQERKQTWEYLIFLTGIVSWTVSYKEFSQIVGYAPNWRMQRIMIMGRESAAPLLREFRQKGYYDGENGFAVSSAQMEGIETGVDYVAADTLTDAATPSPYAANPEASNRGRRSHSKTQNELAEFVENQGLKPLSPGQFDPAFDLAWFSNPSTLIVAEVKSITAANEEKQLRLGLGQVLRYRFLLRKRHKAVKAVLVIERAAGDPDWVALCHDLGVALIWPTKFSQILQL